MKFIIVKLIILAECKSLRTVQEYIEVADAFRSKNGKHPHDVQTASAVESYRHLVCHFPTFRRFSHG